MSCAMLQRNSHTCKCFNNFFFLLINVIEVWRYILKNRKKKFVRSKVSRNFAHAVAACGWCTQINRFWRKKNAQTIFRNNNKQPNKVNQLTWIYWSIDIDTFSHLQTTDKSAGHHSAANAHKQQVHIWIPFCFSEITWND